MTTGSISIRPLTTIEEAQICEELQRQAWGMSELEIVPAPLLLTAAKNEGLLLGAFDGGRMIGFTFGFLGADPAKRRGLPVRNRIKLCSHMTAVLPEYQNRGIGYSLKLAQREHTLDKSVNLITWTYDPLEARNAMLNIAKLGAVCHTYLRNVYGTMNDSLNAGLPTDRFEVEWWIASQRVKVRLSRQRSRLKLDLAISGGAQVLSPAAFASDGTPWPSAWQQPTSLMALVEIPANFQALKRKDIALAQAWRQHTRELFEACFAAGYIVTDFLYETAGWPRSFYLLTRQEDPHAVDSL